MSTKVLHDTIDCQGKLKKNIRWRINEQIRSNQIRVIDDNGKQVGVMTAQEALTKAKKVSKDLVEIAPKANPPVAKIVELGKFLYEQEKRQREQKRKTKVVDVKEVRFSPFIAQGDYNTRVMRVKEFLDDGHKVRLVVVFKGRQMKSKDFGYGLLKKVVDMLGNAISTDMEPKFLGRHLVMVISPLKKAKTGEKQNAKTKN